MMPDAQIVSRRGNCLTIAGSFLRTRSDAAWGGATVCGPLACPSYPSQARILVMLTPRQRADPRGQFVCPSSTDSSLRHYSDPDHVGAKKKALHVGLICPSVESAVYILSVALPLRDGPKAVRPLEVSRGT